MSTFEVPVFRIHLEPHDNADFLSVVHPFGPAGFQVVTRTDEWEEGSLAVYIPPESVVPPDEEMYGFLKSKKDGDFSESRRRIRARRFKGEWSFGLIMPAPPGSNEGDNVADLMQITHYEPPMKEFGPRLDRSGPTDYAKGPKMKGPRYDLENLRRYAMVIADGTRVHVSEKIHGTQIRMTFQNGRFHVASRNFYREEFWAKSPKTAKAFIKFWLKKLTFQKPDITWNPSFYWSSFKSHPELMEIVKANSPFIFYGELYGEVQVGFPYDSTVTRPHRIRIFDAYDPEHRRFLELGQPWHGVVTYHRIPVDDDILPYATPGDLEIPSSLHVPLDAHGMSFSMEAMEGMCKKPSRLTIEHIREGIVVKPVRESHSPLIGRVVLKIVNPNYLEKL